MLRTNWTYPLFQVGLAVLAVLAAQMLYLFVVALAGDCMQVKPEPPQPPTFHEQVNPPAPTLEEIAAKLIPWNLPALAGAIHLVLVAWGLLWWAPRLASAGEAEAEEAEEEGERKKKRKGSKEEPPPAQVKPRWWVTALFAAGAAVAAGLLPLVTTFCPGGGDLRGKKIVMYKEGFLNWLKPEHGQYGRYSIGMYGMMPAYLASLGARPLISEKLSEADLHDADALILFFPNELWKDGQLKRIRDFVQRGGTLAVFGEHTVMESPPEFLLGAACSPVAGSLPVFSSTGASSTGGVLPASSLLAASCQHFESRFNEVLQPTAMRVRFDSATFAVGGWLQSYEALAHPTTAGIGDARNEFGPVIGASVRTRWPARPFLVGRYGWADPGNQRAGASMMGNHLYNPGEKLGDLVLAAEQPLGRGRVIVFGDTSGMTNGLTVGCHRYTSRLLTYLGAPSSTPLDAWRQLVGLLAALVLVGLLIARPNPWAPAAVAVVMAITLAACTEASYRAWNVLPGPGKTTLDDEKTPDGKKTPDGNKAPGGEETPNNVAYIDASHAEAYTPESWRPEGVMGLAMTLMRNGYLTLMLPELTRQRLLRPGVTPEMLLDPEVEPDKLLRARVLVSIGPGREFSEQERRLVRDFVRAGGIFICTAGYEERGPVRSLLSGTAPRPAPLEKPRTLTDAHRFSQTREYKVKYSQVLRETHDLELAEKQAATFAARFHLLKDTEVYKQKYDEALKKMRKENVAEQRARELAREHAARFAAQHAEPYGEEAGFGFHLGVRPSSSGQQPREPEPLGHCWSPFFRGSNYLAHVRFHAAWPVYCDDPNALVVAYRPADCPVIIVRRYGRGLVAVIGDTCFAMNKNLEREDGKPFEGSRENADFWRWFLGLLGEGEMWYPPRPKGIPLPPDPTPPESPLVLPPESLPPPKSTPPPAAGGGQPQEKP